MSHVVADRPPPEATRNGGGSFPQALLHGIKGLLNVDASKRGEANNEQGWVAETPLGCVGRQVRVVDLRATMGLNGLRGTIIHFDYSKGRYQVRLGGDRSGTTQLITVRPRNLRLIDHGTYCSQGTTPSPPGHPLTKPLTPEPLTAWVVMFAVDVGGLYLSCTMNAPAPHESTHSIAAYICPHTTLPSHIRLTHLCFGCVHGR